MNKILVLDLDGTILDCRDRHYACYRSILIKNNLQPLPIDEYWIAKRLKIDIAQILKRSGGGDHYNIFMREWLYRIEDKNMLLMDKLHPGALAVLHHWKKNGYHLILVTARRNAEALAHQLLHLGIKEMFAEILLSSVSGPGEIKARTFLNNHPSEAPKVLAWIGDTEADIEAGRYLRTTTVAVSCGIRDRCVLGPLAPDYLVRDLPDFAEHWRVDPGTG